VIFRVRFVRIIMVFIFVSTSLSSNCISFTDVGCMASSESNVESTTQKEPDKFKEFNREPFIKKYIQNVFRDKTVGNLRTKAYGWYYKHIENGVPPLPPPETVDFVSKYDCYYIGNPDKKVIYLTFDEGYENGQTEIILDTLKKHNVKAAFFVVKPYILANPELINRMVEEGHLVCNHSSRHLSMPTITDYEKFSQEFKEVEEAYQELIGKEMPKYFRPPMGKYSELSLNYTQEYGYKTVFWSFAYADWEKNKQPSVEFAQKRILERTHNGAVILLHAVSTTNAKILESIITEWKNQGYEIKSLDEFEK
jgi:peptidoglycan-N-acetylmuramic acid deacetylase